MEPFVPERDGRIGNPAGGAQTGKAQPQIKEPPPARQKAGRNGSSMSKTIVVLLFIISALLLVMTFLQRNSINSLQQQFDDLQAKIDSTDESLSQSGTTLSLRIQQQGETLKGHESKLSEHFSEIDKLWAARKKINTSIGGVETQLEVLEKQLGGFDKKISEGTQAAKQAETNLAALRKEVLALKLAMDNLESRSDNATAKVSEVERSIKQWQSKTDQRLASLEEAIRAIDSFRRQMNNDMLNLRNSQGGSEDLSTIKRDIQLLKSQHPYLQNN
jgi:chromosome segregation ATPase